MPELPKKIRGHCGGHLLFEKDGRKNFKLLFRPIFGLLLNISKSLGSSKAKKRMSQNSQKKLVNYKKSKEIKNSNQEKPINRRKLMISRKIQFFLPKKCLGNKLSHSFYRDQNLN
jgi:hypothetical protein